MKRTFLTIVLLLVFLAIHAQRDTIFYVGDTVYFQSFHPNGNLFMQEKGVIGKDEYSFQHLSNFDEEGNLVILIYFDTEKDTSNYIIKRFRKNGTIKLYLSNNKTVKENKKGELIKVSIRDFEKQCSIVEKYKNGNLIKIKEIPFSRRLKTPQIDTVKHYEGQAGGTRIVVITQQKDENQYYVNGVNYSESQYYEYEKKYDAYFKSRKKKHIYQEYTKDSILIYQGLYRKVNLSCGFYEEYYPDGTIKMRGQCNNRGYQDGNWHYYDEEGRYYLEKIYKNGRLLKKTGTNNTYISCGPWVRNWK